MIKPNWDIFKSKFSENPQSNFEWFCYLLFCKETNNPHGIFRYKNQSGLETNPVIINNQLTGWQAKFYEDTLSKHKPELIKTLDTTKRDYPQINKLIFYSNQEWGQGKKQLYPQVKLDIEQHAKVLQIEVEWRTTSFFESSFVVEENQVIASHFFQNQSAFDLMDIKRRHTESIFSRIHTHNTLFEIDRASTINEIITELNKKQVVIISGTGGVGKTAVIKKVYEALKDASAFYIFKATEFEIHSIDNLFGHYSLNKFIEIHENIKNKIIVIDSAEKLLGLRDTTALHEFLSSLIQNNWKIAFTTRDNYLDTLNFELNEIYTLLPFHINIQPLGIEELSQISEDHNFILPNDHKIVELLKNPFYLNEYLTYYIKDEDVDYQTFKSNLWNKIITKSNPSREQCFSKLARESANSGQFFINIDDYAEILNELMLEGLLGYEATGYFITHDIYEEWALERIIDAEFIKSKEHNEFFSNIGTSLGIRKSFRNWVSEKLHLDDSRITSFIEETIDDSFIEQLWKDEILISILLSKYADIFFNYFSEDLLKPDYLLLKKLSFLLRLACKEVDNDMFKDAGLTIVESTQFKYMFSKPKGYGWNSFIKFIHDHFDEIGIKNINFILPIISDWNSKFKNGETTKISSLIALKFYQLDMEERIHLYRNKNQENVLKTILYGASEIKEELQVIFATILTNRYRNHSAPYYDLVKMILTELDGLHICKVLPSQVLQLAELFWYEIPERDNYYHSRLSVDEDYCIVDNYDFEYFPASAYQTPIYWLLQFKLKETIDFIIDFTNKTVECYTKSELDYSVVEIDVYINEELSVKQYLSSSLWGMYRGTGSPVSPYLLQAIHMALEKFWLERAKYADIQVLESWLKYLITKSRSCSISSVVTSVVLAYPEKTFNIAAMLFKTKEFVIYDLSRSTVGESGANSLYSIGYGLNYANKMHEDERLKSCEDKHRKFSLETILLNYQFFKDKDTSDEEFSQRQKLLWDIIDTYYEKIKSKTEITEADQTWQFFLARIDRRKMNPTVEKQENGTLIYFNPELPPELAIKSQQIQAEHTEFSKYIQLQLWSDNKLEKNNQYKNYNEYEDEPLLALTQIQKIAAFSYDELQMHFLSPSIMSNVCSLMIRDHLDRLNLEDKIFCKEIILEYAKLPFLQNYFYRVADGTPSAILTLPTLMGIFPEEKNEIKLLILLLLFQDSYGYDNNLPYKSAIKSIQNDLWKTNKQDAKSLLLGFLVLKSKYDTDIEKLVKEDNERYFQQINNEERLQIFFNNNESTIQKIIDNQITLNDLEDIGKEHLYILNIAFQLIPLDNDDEDIQKITLNILQIIIPKLLQESRRKEIRYEIKNELFRRLSYLLLSSQQHDLLIYLQIIIDNFKPSENMAKLFQEIILAEDYLDQYNNFWLIWNQFKDKIIEMCHKGDGYSYISETITSYLFADIHWREDAKEWHTFKDQNKRFFKKTSESIGHCPSTLFAFSRLLYGIGSCYLSDGIKWISTILTSYPSLHDTKLETNTLFYLENISRKYIFEHRDKIKTTVKLKNEILVILNFLTERGSSIGYLLRDEIL